MPGELVDRLAATPGVLAHLVAEVADELLDRSPEAGGWSARTVLAHFRDDEFLCLRPGLARMLAEVSPALALLDGGAWEPGRNRSRDRKAWLLADFALQRQASVSVLRSLRPAEWERRGSAAGRGTFTVREFVGGWLEHDVEHIAQLERTLGESLQEVLERRARR